MLPEDTQQTPAPTAPAPRRTRRFLIAGAALGVAALGLAATTAGAADDSPTVTAPQTIEGDSGTFVFSDEAGDVDGMLFDDETWKAFDDCMTRELGDLIPQIEALEEAHLNEDGSDHDIDDAAFDAIFNEENEQRFVDAEAACEGLLPQEIQDEIAAFKPFEECIDAAFAGIDDTLKGVDEGNLTEAQLEELEAAFETTEQECESLLPEGALMFDDAEFCDEHDGDEGSDGETTDTDLDESSGDDVDSEETEGTDSDS